MNEDPPHRRRRRRPITTSTETCSARKRSIPLVQDVSFRLVHSEKQVPRRNVHTLLHLKRRELGIWSRGGVLDWQEKMLRDQGGNGWRRFARRTLTFRQLQTPAEDAILGIDSTGSYAVALGGYSEREDEPLCFQDHGLFIRLYGLPSKARAPPFSWNTIGAPVSPLLHTIPVSYVVDDLWLHEMSFPAVLATSIMIHRDGTLGVAKVGSLQSVPSNHPYARIDDVITLFPLLGSRKRTSLAVRTLNLGKRYNNLDLYLFSSNAKTLSSTIHNSQHKVPCKVLVIHHGSIMRFCWIKTFAETWVPQPMPLMTFVGDSQVEPTANHRHTEHIRLDIGKVCPLDEADALWENKVYNLSKEWEENLDDYETLLSETAVVSEMDIFSELKFDIFFVCLEVRRLVQRDLGLSTECRKENTLNLFVCTHDDCSRVELIVSFRVKDSRLAAFVTIDLGANQLNVVKWVFMTRDEDPEKWLFSLRSLRLGDIREHRPSWSFLEKMDIECDSNRHFWRLKNEWAGTNFVAYSPPELDQADMLDNLGVLRHVPVHSFSHPMASTRIVYSQNGAART